MPLPGSVFAAPPGVHGFDVNSVLNRRTCETAKARGFAFCIRYVSRQDVQPKEDLSEIEASIILDAGLALMPVQHVTPESWSSQALGTRNGKNAAKHAQQIGFPEGVNVWLDLEGAKASTPHETMIAYCKTSAAPCSGCPRVDRLTREFLNGPPRPHCDPQCLKSISIRSARPPPMSLFGLGSKIAIFGTSSR